MHYVVTLDNINDPTGLDTDVPDDATHLHFLYWEEEAHTKQEMLYFISGNAKKLVQKNAYTYHCNILGPKHIENTANYQAWPDYDLILAFQKPRKIKHDIVYKFCCMQNSLGYHRDYICDKLYGKDGLLSYNELNSDEGYLYEKYLEDCKRYPLCEKKWQGQIPKFLPWSDHDKDFVVEYADNPPPPLDYWEKCLINIVTESYFDILDITEKSFSSVIHGRPTVIVGAENVNKYLFDTYGLEPLPGIDYNFDAYENLTDRIDDLCEQIIHKDFDEQKMLKTAKYNQQALIKYIANMPLPQVLDSAAVFSENSEKIKQRIRKIQHLTKNLVSV